MVWLCVAPSVQNYQIFFYVTTKLFGLKNAPRNSHKKYYKKFVNEKIVFLKNLSIYKNLLRIQTNNTQILN